jgi:hypothetical protein
VATPNQKLERRLIASYGKDRILVADLSEENQDEWMICDLLNAADLIGARLRQAGFPCGRPLKIRAESPGHCIEVEAVNGGFLAYELLVEDAP